MKIRPEVMVFAEMMERRLREEGNWSNDDNTLKVIIQCVDVANLAMLIFNKLCHENGIKPNVVMERRKQSIQSSGG